MDLGLLEVIVERTSVIFNTLCLQAHVYYPAVGTHEHLLAIAYDHVVLPPLGENSGKSVVHLRYAHTDAAAFISQLTEL